MDKTILRTTALNIASMRVPQTDDVDALLAEAEKIVAWLSAGAVPVADAPAVPSEPAQHESDSAQ